MKVLKNFNLILTVLQQVCSSRQCYKYIEHFCNKMYSQQRNKNTFARSQIYTKFKLIP